MSAGATAGPHVLERQFDAFLGALDEVLRRLHDLGLLHRAAEDAP